MRKHNRVQVCKPENVVGKIESGRGENSNCWSVWSRYEKFFNECINGFSENERIVMLGDMNAKVGNREVCKVVGKYGVLGVIEKK